MILVSRLLQAMPHASGPWLAGMVETMPKWGIVGPVREAAFLGQMRHECGDFSRFVENLNYSDPERIARIFRRAFDLDGDKVLDANEVEFARRYVRNPVALANRAYAGKYGNRDEASGDGWRYRGRGPIHITFADNYRLYGDLIGHNLLANPDDLLVPRIGARASCAYFQHNDCNAIADTWNKTAITRKINPGLAGLNERDALMEETRRVLEGK